MAMTMLLDATLESESAAAEAGLVARLKAGDEVQFTAERMNGQISVTSIKKGS